MQSQQNLTVKSCVTFQRRFEPNAVFEHNIGLNETATQAI